MTEFEIKSVYDFDTYSPGLLGHYRDAMVLGIVGAEIARTIDDVAAKHANVLGTLPPGSPHDHASFEYLLIRKDGQTHVIGIPWIIDSTVERKTGSILRVTIRNVGQNATTRVRHLLAAGGHDVESIELL